MNSLQIKSRVIFLLVEHRVEHNVWGKRFSSVIPYVCSDDQLGDILMKPLARASFQCMPFKLGMFDRYAPT